MMKKSKYHQPIPKGEFMNVNNKIIAFILLVFPIFFYSGSLKAIDSQNNHALDIADHHGGGHHGGHHGGGHHGGHHGGGHHGGHHGGHRGGWDYGSGIYFDFGYPGYYYPNYYNEPYYYYEQPNEQPYYYNEQPYYEERNYNNNDLQNQQQENQNPQMQNP